MPSLAPPPRRLADGWTPETGALSSGADPVGAPPPAPDYDALVRAEAQRQGVPPELAVAIFRRENPTRDPHAISSAGAEGLMQLMPDTARGQGVKNSFDPQDNIRGGIKYFKSLLDRHKGDQRLALASYNAGPAAVARYKDTIPPYRETQTYVDSIVPTPGVIGNSRTPEPFDPRTFQPAPLGSAGTPEPFDPATFQAAPAAPPGTPPLPVLPGGAPGSIPKPSTFEQGTPGLATRAGLAVMDALNPMTPEGRRNLAGAGGAALGTAAVVGTGGVATPLVAAAAGTLGAFGGGMIAESGEQLVGNAPPSGAAVVGRGAEQGAYQLAGEGLIWPVRALANRVLARPISQRAFAALKATRADLSTRLTTALDAAKDALGVTREQAIVAKQQIADTTRDAVGQVRQTLAATKAGETAAGAPYAAQVAAPPPSAVAAGQAAHAVIAGPATRAKQAAGRAVGEAAQSGPPVDIGPLKAHAQAILDREVTPAAGAFPTNAMAEGAATGGAAFPLTRTPNTVQEAQRALLDTAQVEGAKDRLKHPILGIVQRILNADDTVPFAAAHGFQRELDDALLGTWDKAEKKRVSSMTEGLRGTLRETLRNANHAPFEAASARYAQVVKLFTKGLGPQLKQTAVDDPEAIVGLISVQDPTKVGMLRELLTTTAAEGGGGPEGQAAWDGVRAAWTHREVLRGGIEHLGDRLDALSPDFTRELYGDAPGQAVLGNLQALRASYDAALTAAEDALRPTQVVAQAQRRQVATAQRRHIQFAKDRVTDVQHLIRDAKAVTPEEAVFLASSIAPGKTHSIEEIAADAFRAGALFPGIWGGISLMRLLRGPKGGDLLRYVAASPKLTQIVVQALNRPFSPIGPEAAANLARVGGAFVSPRARASAVGQPPPASAPPPH